MTRTALKFFTFAAVMSLLTVFMIMVFAEYRTGSTHVYRALFTDISGLKPGDSVRVAGVRVGTVKRIELQSDRTVLAEFDADDSVVLTNGTRAAVRYLNLVNDRYLELADSPGSTVPLPAGSEIPLDRTAPALDLDLMLGGLKPVIQGLNPQDVNALTASLVQIVQGQGGTMESLLSQTSSFTGALADNSRIVEQLIDNLNTTMATLARDGEKFSGTIDRLHRLMSELAEQRDPIGEAIDSLSNGTAALSDLLAQSRQPLAKAVDQLARLAPNLDMHKDRVATAIDRAPENYRKLIRLGSYGSFVNYYICELNVRVSDLQNRTAVFPVFRQEGGRCGEPQ
jgi:phospholipid/cholesterol/gamma-HCH transport system substrate-binding protein